MIRPWGLAVHRLGHITLSARLVWLRVQVPLRVARRLDTEESPFRTGGNDVLTSVRKAIDLVGHERRYRWVVLVVLALITSGFEMLSAALVYVLLALVADPTGRPALPVIGDVQGSLDIDQQTLLLGLACIMALVFSVRALVRLGETYAHNRIGYNAGARLSTRLISGYLTMPYAFHLHRNSAELIRNGHQAVNELVRQVFLPTIRIAAEIVLVVAMLALLAVIAPVATVLAVVVVGSAAALLLLVIQPRLKRLGLRAHNLEKDTLSTLQQSLQGVRDIKMLGLEQTFARIYYRARRGLARATYLRATARELPRTVIETALISFILIFFAFAVATGADSDGILSVLGLFAYAGLRIEPSLHRITAGLNDLKYATAPLDDIHADLMMIESAESITGSDEAIPFRRALALESVSLRYEGGGQNAIDSIDLTIEPGEIIGVCGPTGGGKTTLVDIMTGLLTPTQGRVTVDGLDLQQHARGWQRLLGVVPQMVFLTDDTLRRNIALGVPDSRIDEDAVEEALGLAQLAEFVATLPAGLDTIVGERGVRLSGGQRQRVAIARALYRRPGVLVFDEGTSALDNATEAELMASLERLRGNHTIIMVAHRLSTVRGCDRIVYVDGGRIAGIGNYAGLIESNSSFRRLAAVPR